MTARNNKYYYDNLDYLFRADPLLSLRNVYHSHISEGEEYFMHDQVHLLCKPEK